MPAKILINTSLKAHYPLVRLNLKNTPQSSKRFETFSSKQKALRFNLSKPFWKFHQSLFRFMMRVLMQFMYLLMNENKSFLRFMTLKSLKAILRIYRKKSKKSCHKQKRPFLSYKIKMSNCNLRRKPKSVCRKYTLNWVFIMKKTALWKWNCLKFN